MAADFLETGGSAALLKAAIAKSESGCSDIYRERKPIGRKARKPWKLQAEINYRREPGRDSVTMLSALTVAIEPRGLRLFKV